MKVHLNRKIYYNITIHNKHYHSQRGGAINELKRFWDLPHLLINKQMTSASLKFQTQSLISIQ